MNLVWVFIGGGLGSLVRFAFSKLFHDPVSAFPLSTFLSNLLASLILGFVLGWLFHHKTTGEQLRLFVAVGFCGGFSTFSAFSFDNFSLLANADYKTLFLNVIANLFACYFAVAAGFVLSRYF